jgi:hypothetical protein
VNASSTYLREMDATFEFDAELWRWDARADASWIFVSLPRELSEDIEDLVPNRRGFGSVKVTVRTGSSEWKTSVFPDSKSRCFALPVKKTVRSKERIDVGDVASFEIDVALA